MLTDENTPELPIEPGQDPSEPASARRVGLTLMAVKAALQKWTGHMRRAEQMKSEDEYALALALVPRLPNPPAYQARTLRAWADLCASQGRLDEAVALFDRVAQSPGRLSDVFWRDYATLVFKLALRRVAGGQVASANAALQQAGILLAGPADQPPAWKAAWEGYGETALWFERAGEAVPAGLYAEKALAYAERLGVWTLVGPWLRRLAQAGLAKGGPGRGLVWLDRLQSLRTQGWPDALSAAVQASVVLAQAELAVGRAAGAQQIFAAAEAWLKAAGGESPALADLHLGWGLALGNLEGRTHLELALSLRRRLLGPTNPRTREAEQALGGLSAEAEPLVSEGPRDWNGGALFEAPVPSASGDAELKRLHRRLARLCHPDGVLDPVQAAWSHEMMVRVNQAADVNDLFTLRTMLREVLARRAEARSAADGALPAPVGFQPWEGE